MVAAAVALLVAAPAHADTSWIRGGNWMPDDGNNNGGIFYPSGINSSTSPAEAASYADLVAGDDMSVGINFVRIAINPATISGNWPVFQAYVNELIADGQWVDLCDFGENNDGSVDNFSAWQGMWETVDGVYKNNNAVYYEPLNEPHSYSTESELATDVYVPFLGFINKSQDHIILDGTGWAASAAPVGADSRFNNCKLAIHCYYFDNTNLTSEAEWENDLNTRVGGYQSRTVMTEMGCGTTGGLDYDVSTPGNLDISYIRGMCNQCRAWPMGFVYFPAHKDNDGSRLFVSAGGGIVNQSMINELQNGWDFYTTAPVWGICDFNVIGQTDYSVYRPSVGWWYFQAGGSVQWGTNIDIAVPADYAGNGLAQEAVWRTSDSTWYVHGVTTLQYGTTGDIPVPGDYLGTGQAQIAVFRPSAGKWYVNGMSSAVQWGQAGDIPVPGYYNNDGHLDMAVYRPSNCTWYIDGGANVQWGEAGDIPVPGDYDGSGTTQIAIWRPSNGTWIVHGGATVQWGTNGDVPVPGDYAGAGYTQMAVWRPSNDTWYVKGVGNTTYGMTNDVPLPLPYAIRHYSLGYTN